MIDEDGQEGRREEMKGLRLHLLNWSSFCEKEDSKREFQLSNNTSRQIFFASLLANN